MLRYYAILVAQPLAGLKPLALFAFEKFGSCGNVFDMWRLGMMIAAMSLAQVRQG